METFVSVARLLTDRASDVYDQVEFKTDDLYNEPAPAEWISFMIGGIFSAVGTVLYVRRYLKLMKAAVGGGTATNSIRLRAMIAAFVDNDSSTFTIVKLAAQSFLFLGGLQYNFELSFSVMLGWFAVESTCDSIRILIAFSEVTSLKELILTSTGLKSQLRNATTQLKPSNVYEDISRSKLIVFMVFVTQCLLIAFVVADIFDTETHTCHDGTPGCPVVGTLGSWCFYVLGIFMASVFLLGPKTSFGQSEQNPAYWLQLLLSAKQAGAQCTWYDPVQDKIITRDLYPKDWRLWLRFFMSFLINGVGFYILVHALPIQVATQSSLTGVVFRAVGMMYLVDLDDTPGYTLTLVEKEHVEEPAPEETVAPPSTPDDVSKPEEVVQPEPEVADQSQLQEGELSAQAQRIIDEARAQLDALAAGKPVKQKMGVTGALAMAGGVGLVTAGTAVAANNNVENGGDQAAVLGEEGGVGIEGGGGGTDGADAGGGGGGVDF